MDDHDLSRCHKGRTVFVPLSYKLLFFYTLVNPLNGLTQEAVKKASQEGLFKDLNTIATILEHPWESISLLILASILYAIYKYSIKKMTEPLVDILFDSPGKIAGLFKKVSFRSPPKEQPLETATYRKLLNKHTEKLQLVGYPAPLKVSSLTTFVDLLFDFPDQQEDNLEEKEKLADKEKSKTYTLKETLQRFIQLSNDQKMAGLLCLVGEPGSGKTSLIKYLIQRFLNGENKKENDPLGIKENYQPLYLPLHFIGKQIKKDNDPLTYFLSEFSGGDLSGQYFTDYLQQKNVMILLDGLDEVPVQRLAMVVKFIEQLQNDYSDHLIIITTRIPTYHQCVQQDLLPFDTIKASILPMEPDKQQDFIANIFEQLDTQRIRWKLNKRLSKTLKPLNHSDWTKRFITALSTHKGGLEKIRTVPFLLQTVAILWLTDSENRLPDNKAGLYYRLLYLMLVDYVRYKYEEEEGEAKESLDFTTMLHLLGRVALTMAMGDDETIDIYFITFQQQLVLAGKILGLSEEQLATYQTHLTDRTQIVQLIQYFSGDKQNNDQQNEDEWYRFTHKSLMEYLAAWALRHYQSEIKKDPQMQELLDTMLGRFFGLSQKHIQVNDKLAGNEEENLLNTQINLTEILTFYTQIPDEDLYDSERKNRDERIKCRSVMISGEQVLIDLVQLALSDNYWQRLYQDKFYEYFFYSLFKGSPLISPALFKKPQALVEGKEQWLQLKSDFKQLLQAIHDPEQLIFFFKVIEAVLLSLQGNQSQKIRDEAATLLLGWLDQQGKSLLNVHQPPPEEKSTYVYQLVLHKVEALIRECDKNRLPDLPWIARAIPEIDKQDLFTEKVKRFVNPVEYNAEYIFIPKGEFPAYDDGGSWVNEGLEAHKRSEAYYLARYPVTFRQYRRFIDYLASKDHELHQYLSLDDFIKRLEKFAEHCDKGKKFKFVGYLPKKDSNGSYAALLRSENETSQGFNSDDQPVCGVNWYDASSYCFWLSCLHVAKDKKPETFMKEPLATLLNLFRLPHETEWYWAAARHTDVNKSGMKDYCWTDRITMDEKCDEAKRYQQVANYNENIGKTTSVGLYPLGGSTDGLMDMSGNGWEWQSNWIKSKYYEGPALRGGSWFLLAGYLPCSVRDCDDPGGRNGFWGFRVSFSRSKFEKIDMPKK